MSICYNRFLPQNSGLRRCLGPSGKHFLPLPLCCVHRAQAKPPVLYLNHCSTFSLEQGVKISSCYTLELYTYGLRLGFFTPLPLPCVADLRHSAAGDGVHLLRGERVRDAGREAAGPHPGVRIGDLLPAPPHPTRQGLHRLQVENKDDLKSRRLFNTIEFLVLLCLLAGVHSLQAST